MYIKENNHPHTDGTTFTIEQNINGKMHRFHTSEYGFKWDVEYDYRVVTKCRAGFFTISDGKSTLQNLVNRYQKNALHTIELKSLKSDTFLTALALKGGKFATVANCILENIEIGTIHSSFPKMADHGHWKAIGSKTWADNAYRLQDSFKNVKLVEATVGF
tara:strand:- start:451 stop:933 length:483 start_codon:yes stop_codon:yes gene_type:complete